MKYSLRQILPFSLICLTGFILNLIAFYPGFLSPDSLEQYQQSLTGIYTDWHPPAMAYFWRQLNKIHQGPGLMLVFQLACLWFSIFYLLTSIKSRAWQILVVLFAIMPFVQNFAGYIIKDTHMAVSWLLAFAIIFKALINNRKLPGPLALVSALLLLYGTWTRPNALTGLLPLTLLWAYVSFPSQKQRFVWLRGAGLAVLIVTGQVVFSKFINPQHTHPESKLFMLDLTGIFVKTGENVFPAVLYEEPKFDTAYLRQKYHPATFDNIWWNADDKVALSRNDDEMSAALKAAWVHAIAKHPGIYLKNRMKGVLYYLRIRNREDNFMYHFRWMQPNDLGLTFNDNILTEVFLKPVDIQKRMPYMRPWFWFCLNLILCGAVPAIKRREYRFSVAALAFSGLLYLLPSFLAFQVDTDFRYFYWNCFACTIACIIFLAYKFKWSGRVNDTKQ